MTYESYYLPWILFQLNNRNLWKIKNMHPKLLDLIIWNYVHTHYIN